jgi:hypothetical protein
MVMSLAPVTAQAVIDRRLEWPGNDDVLHRRIACHAVMRPLLLLTLVAPP